MAYARAAGRATVDVCVWGRVLTRDIVEREDPREVADSFAHADWQLSIGLPDRSFLPDAWRSNAAHRGQMIAASVDQARASKDPDDPFGSTDRAEHGMGEGQAVSEKW